MAIEEMQAVNTDKELWSDEHGNRVFMTASAQAVGICANGRCVVKPLADWVKLGWHGTIDERFERLEAAVRELNPGLHP